MTQLLNTILKKIKTSQTFRQQLAYSNHLWFFRIYLNHYLTYKMAGFHNDMFAITEDESWQMAAIMAFRGSGKSTIMNLSFALWAVLGRLQKKFVIIISDNKYQSCLQLDNIRQELINNDLLLKDFGPLLEQNNGHSSTRFLTLPKYGAKIMSITSHRSIRGLRNGPYRPDLIICDDIEDSSVSKNRCERERVYDWFMHEIIANIDTKTKVVVLGNLLHEKSLLIRLKENVRDKIIDGLFRSYPIIDKNNNILWPDKFKTKEDINKLQQTIFDEDIWRLEYLLQNYVDMVAMREKMIKKMGWDNK